MIVANSSYSIYNSIYINNPNLQSNSKKYNI